MDFAYENAWNQQLGSEKLFPLFAQQRYFSLPEDLNERDKKNLPLFSRLKPQIFLVTYDADYAIEEINQYVNFQYQKEYGRSDFNIEIYDGKKDFSDYSGGLIVEVPSMLNTDRVQDAVSDRAQNSLNLIFSLSPTAQVTLLRLSINLSLEDIIFFRDSLLAFQTKYPDGICISDKNILSPNTLDPSNTLFYQQLLEGKIVDLSDVTSEDLDLNSCVPIDEEKIPKINVEMFFSCGDYGWIQDNVLLSFGIREYFPFCFTKNFICFVGGINLNIEESTIQCYENTSSGFYSSTCAELNPPEYISLYDAKLPEDYKNKIRIPHVSHYTGPFWFPLYKKLKGTLYSTIFFGIQYALMKTFYGDKFITHGKNFLEEIFNAQTSSNNTNQLFLYDIEGTIVPPRIPPFPLPELRNCNNEDYIIRKEGDKFWGLNPCGLGLPQWKSIGWLKKDDIDNGLGAGVMESKTSS